MFGCHLPFAGPGGPDGDAGPGGLPADEPGVPRVLMDPLTPLFPVNAAPPDVPPCLVPPLASGPPDFLAAVASPELHPAQSSAVSPSKDGSIHLRIARFPSTLYPSPLTALPLEPWCRRCRYEAVRLPWCRPRR